MTQHVDAIILNPHARGGAGIGLWRDFQVTELARTLGLNQAKVFDSSEIKMSSKLLPALKEWVGQRVGQGCKNFIVVGGDGTVHLAINALDGFPIRLGAIGLGSSNDFHKPFGSSSPIRASGVHCRIDFESAFPHDLGEVEFFQGPLGVNDRDTQKVLFAVNSSLGFTAEANYFFNSKNPLFRAMKRASTDTAILFAALREFLKFRKFEIVASFDQSAAESLCFINMSIVKNPHFAGEFCYEINQSTDDGLLGVHVCEVMSRLQVMKVFLALSRGRFSGMPRTFSRQCKEVFFSSEKSLVLETDGEVRQVQKARFRVLPQRMLLCP